MNEYQRASGMQLRQLERQRAFLPSLAATPPGSVLMTVLDAVLDESEKIRRRIALLELAPLRVRSFIFSNSILPTTPIMMEADTGSTDKAGEWTLPSEEQIW